MSLDRNECCMLGGLIGGGMLACVLGLGAADSVALADDSEADRPVATPLDHDTSQTAVHTDPSTRDLSPRRAADEPAE